MKTISIATIAAVLVGFASQNAIAGERVLSKYTSTARAKSISFKDHSNVPEGGSRRYSRARWISVAASIGRRAQLVMSVMADNGRPVCRPMQKGPGAFPHKENVWSNGRVEKDGRLLLMRSLSARWL